MVVPVFVIEVSFKILRQNFTRPNIKDAQNKNSRVEIRQNTKIMNFPFEFMQPAPNLSIQLYQKAGLIVSGIILPFTFYLFAKLIFLNYK